MFYFLGDPLKPQLQSYFWLETMGGNVNVQSPNTSWSNSNGFSVGQEMYADTTYAYIAWA